MSERKRFKHEYTILEYLPNELFLDIFGYLNGVDAVYAFSKLNIRLQCLLNDYVNIFDFQSISKYKFHFVTQLHDIHRWRSLRLSDNDDTPGQIKLFFQIFPPSVYMHQLQSLALLNIQPANAQEFFSQIGSFNKLVSLSIGKICGLNIQSVELPSLKRLFVISCKHTHWMMNFHSLESLQYTIENNCSHTHYLALPKRLERLRIFYEETSDGNAVRTLLCQMTQLTTLALYGNARYSPLPDGRIWEELILSSLPLLKTFQFYFPFESYLGTSDNLKRMIASFSTPFYLFEKRWFIRSDQSAKDSVKGTLYSLPFAFSHMKINACSFDTSVSTLPVNDLNKIGSKFYTKIKTLVFNHECEAPHPAFLPSNIIQLVLMANLPTTWINLLTQLRHLQIGRDVTMSSTDFAHLLEHMPNLQSLTISIIKLKLLTDKFNNQIVCRHLTQQIRSLIISHHYLDTPSLGYVSVRLLSSLTRIFSLKCEHLSLALAAHLNTVRPILRRMRQLRSLHIQWRYGHSEVDDPIAYWLEQQSTALDFVHTIDKRHFFVWFGNLL